MNESQLHFDERLRRLGRKHRALERGFQFQMQPDGLVVAIPRKKNVVIPVRPFAVALAVFMSAKVFLIVSLGQQSYSERVAQLQYGSLVDQAGAALMQMDPVSGSLAEAIAPLTR